jgi:outer membrane protein OmpA-like peptidoglycan-associated protein
MTKVKKESFFWTSYSDLMTSMFFVMLVLFVFTIVLYHKKIKSVDEYVSKIEEYSAKLENLKYQLDSITQALVRAEGTIKATQAQLNKVKEIEESIKNINPEYFEYDSQYKRHTLKNISVSFRRGSSYIYDIPQDQLYKLLSVGSSIKQFVDDAAKANPNVKYLLILEGQSSRDSYVRNYELSYERALALFKYWQDNGIDCNTNHCEVIISGSGHESPFRVQPDISSNAQNQRFVIHIIPKPGIIQ